jgi:hypothetical protein
MRRVRLCWVLGAAVLAGVLAGAACDDGEGPAGDGQVTLDEFDEAYAEALCAYAVRCPAAGGDDLFYMTGGSTSVSACVSRLRSALGLAAVTPGDIYRAATGRGAGSWDAALAADCFDAMQTASCDDFESGAMEVEHRECIDMFDGSVATGSACYLDAECANGWCDTSSACPGTCAAFAAPGAPCGGSGGDCGPGYECGIEGTCVAAVVDTLLSEGQACGVPNTTCRYGLYCDEGTESCRAYVAENSACGEGTADCIPGTICHPTDGRCTRVQLATTAGAACGETTLTMCDPLSNLHCDRTTGQCATLPGNGQPCVDMGFFGMCGAGAYCGPDDLCHTKLADGAACENDNWCQSDECRGTCLPATESCGGTDVF